MPRLCVVNSGHYIFPDLISSYFQFLHIHLVQEKIGL